jgi:hypothetical protein
LGNLKPIGQSHCRVPSRGRVHGGVWCVPRGALYIPYPHSHGKTAFHGEVTNILEQYREVLSVDVEINEVPGERRCLIELRKWSDDEHMEGSWPTGTLCPDNARSMAELLLDAAEVAELLDAEPRAGIIGVRHLPVISLCGKRFYIDARLRQLRNVENPMHYFDLDDPFKK